MDILYVFLFFSPPKLLNRNQWKSVWYLFSTFFIDWNWGDLTLKNPHNAMALSKTDNTLSLKRNYIWYFSKKWQKSASQFLGIFFHISQRTGQKSVKISVVSILGLFYRLALSLVKKNMKIKKNIFLAIRRWFDSQKSSKCIGFVHARRRDQTNVLKFHLISSSGMAILHFLAYLALFS